MRAAAVALAFGLVLGLVGAAAGLTWGYLSYHYRYPPYPEAWMAIFAAKEWLRGDAPFVNPGREGAPDAEPQAVDDRLRRLESLGYLGAVNRVESSGVTVYDRTRTFDGPRLVTLGVRPEAQLIAPDGKLLHVWSLPFEEAFPGGVDVIDNHSGAGFWRRVLPLDDGGVLAVHDRIGMVRLDRESNVVWARANRAHHAVIASERGTFYFLAVEREVVDWMDPARRILHEYVVEMNGDGEELRRFSLLEAFRRSSFAPLLNAAPADDPTHANSLQELDGRFAGRIPAFRRGALLTSMRHMSAISVVDPDRGVVEWAAAGQFRFQHEPILLDSGNLLVFDNYGDSDRLGLTVHDEGRSRVLEMDPATRQVVWSYDNEDGGLFTSCCGAAQRLPNGNTFIVESNNGRIFEVTPEREIVWEYYTPERSGDYIARLMDAFVMPKRPSWLDAE